MFLPFKYGPEIAVVLTKVKPCFTIVIQWINSKCLVKTRINGTSQITFVNIQLRQDYSADFIIMSKNIVMNKNEKE